MLSNKKCKFSTKLRTPKCPRQSSEPQKTLLYLSLRLPISAVIAHGAEDRSPYMTDATELGDELPPARKPRGRQFQPGNPGRKPGSRNKSTLITGGMLQGQASELLATAIEMALNQHPMMLRFLLDRLLPKDRRVRLDLPPLDLPSDAVDAHAEIVRCVSEGELTPAEGAAVGSLIKSFSNAIDVTELTRRMDELERKLKSKYDP
jgi:hypothetical protein